MRCEVERRKKESSSRRSTVSDSASAFPLSPPLVLLIEFRFFSALTVTTDNERISAYLALGPGGREDVVEADERRRGLGGRS